MGKDNPEYYQKSRKKLYGILIGIAVIIGIGFLVVSGGGDDDPLSLETDFDPAILQLDATNEKGDADAPIVLEEFGDFECPFCGRWFRQTLPQIEENYVETGQVKIIYRHYPLRQIHARAFGAAMASECAREQGTDKFWEMHDKLFEGQTRLSESNYRKWANEIGLNMGAFNTCMNEEKYADKINDDIRYAEESGFTGTPAFKVNGQPVRGAQSYEVFDGMFQQALLNPTGQIRVPTTHTG